MRRAPALALVALLVGPAPARAEGARVAVAPFAAMTGDVPLRAGTKAAALLTGELKNVGNVTPVELAPEINEPASKSLQAARDAVTEAQGLARRRKLGATAAAYRKAVAAYDDAAALVVDVAELSDAHVGLGTVLYLTGDDAGGAKEIAQAIALTPSRPFPGEATSPLFTATVARLREKVLSGEKGSLRVESVPAGATVTLDSQQVGHTPLVVKDVPAGKHLWRVLIPTSEAAGGVVHVTAGQRQKVAAAPFAAGPVSQLCAALAANRVDDGVLGHAKAAMATAGAEMIVFGALLARGQDLVLETFLFAPGKGVARLPQKGFDAELLSAGMELFKIAGEIGGRTESPGPLEKLPAKISVEVPPASGAELTEVAWTLPGEAQDKPAEKAGPRRPVDPTKTTTKGLRPRDR